MVGSETHSYAKYSSSSSFLLFVSSQNEVLYQANLHFVWEGFLILYVFGR